MLGKDNVNIGTFIQSITKRFENEHLMQFLRKKCGVFLFYIEIMRVIYYNNNKYGSTVITRKLQEK